MKQKDVKNKKNKKNKQTNKQQTTNKTTQKYHQQIDLYQLCLPFELPPSFRGKFVKIKYFVVCSVKKFGISQLFTTNIPFRIISPISGNVINFNLSNTK